MISEIVFFKQLRHAMQGRTMQNKQTKYSNNSVICSVSPTFIWKLHFKNVQIFYQNSIVVSETHVYVKASSATQATCASAPRIKLENTTSPWH